MKTISDEEFERRFDEGEDIMDYVDVASAVRPNQDAEHVVVTLSFPPSMARGIARAAARVGVSAEALINVWLAERLDEEDSRRSAHPLATA